MRLYCGQKRGKLIGKNEKWKVQVMHDLKPIHFIIKIINIVFYFTNILMASLVSYMILRMLGYV